MSEFDDDVAKAKLQGKPGGRMLVRIRDVDVEILALIATGDRSRRCEAQVRALLSKREDLCRKLRDLGVDPPKLPGVGQ